MSEPDMNDARLRELLERSEAPKPDAEFARALRDRFVQGSIAARQPTRRWRSGLRPIWWVAAAAAVVLFLLSRPVQPRWRLHDAHGVTRVLLDGEPVALAALGSLLQPGARLAIHPQERGTVEFVADGSLLLQLEDHVAVTLPARGRLPWRRQLACELGGQGTLRMSTGSEFVGDRLDIRTESARWQVSGTTFAAIVHGADLCLCVLEGKVRACREGDPLRDIEAGARMTIHSHATAVDYGAMLATERDSLQALQTRAAAVLD